MRWRLLPLLALLTACSVWPLTSRAPGEATPPDDSERLVRRAESAMSAGEHAQAARLFQEVISRPDSAFADRALLGLTRLLVHPGYVGKDYRQASLVADRLQREHPGSPFVSEARAWCDLLQGYLTQTAALESRSRELAERTRELDRRTQELERLKNIDQELERRTQELRARTQELERLKRLDQELERLTHELAQELERRTQELQRLKRLDLQLEKQKKKP